MMEKLKDILNKYRFAVLVALAAALCGVRRDDAADAAARR